MTVPRRRLVAIWALLAVLVTAIVVVEHTDLVRARPGRSAVDPTLLLPVPVEELGALEVAEAGTLHRFERDGSGAWFYHGAHGADAGPHGHAVDPALAGRIEQAVRAFARTRIERRVGGREGTTGDAYGVLTPRLLILAYRPRQSQPLAQYAVGDLAPDTVSRYVDVVGGFGVVTIPGYQVDNLLALVESVRARPGSR